MFEMSAKKDILRMFCVILLIFAWVTNALMCDRNPPGATVPRTPGDGRFQVVINSATDKYVPGVIYTVKLQGTTEQNVVEKFTGFLLVVEPVDGHATQGSGGTFQLKDDSLTRFSDFCPYAVKQASEVAKPEIQVLWTAPPSTAGCVIFRSTVMRTAMQWFMDDGGLTKILCPENDEAQDEMDSMEPCRACDEAKYEMTFEGLWSSLTHPKGFPTDSWRAQFSDLIGASHSSNFRFWEQDDVASEGLRHIAESGNMRFLESELKNQSRNIRTIIKARGLRHSNYNGLKTFAVFRADKDHNLVSFVSKIDPSPDWFVGVSGINLCLSNGSWVLNKVINLYPWDAGTDSGIRYLDPDIPTIPRDRIHKLVWSNDRESPFYDPNNMVKPFAKLRIQQQRTFKRPSCGETLRQTNDYNDDEFYDESPDRDRPQCSMNPWSIWTPCSETCGKGIKRRYRTYVNEALSREFSCNRTDTAEKYCYLPQSCKGQVGSFYDSKVSQPYDNEVTGNGYTDEDSILRDPREDVCGVTEWNQWSSCLDICGKGFRIQYRNFLQPRLAAMHGCDLTVSLQKKSSCPVTPDCNANITEAVETGCEVSGWGPWSECPVTCGMGTRTRSRYFKYPTEDHRKCKLQMQMFDSCVGALPNCPPEKSKEDCLEPKQEGECRNKITRWYFDQVKMRCLRFDYTGCKKSRNNFETEDECKSVCDILREEMADRRSKLRSKYGVELNSAFTFMMADDTGTNCENGTTSVRTRHNKQGGENSMNSWSTSQDISPSHHRQPVGHSSSSLYSHRTSAHSSSSSYPSSTVGKTTSNQLGLPVYSDDSPSVDCKVTAWSAWSQCSVDCGKGWKHQRRYILVPAQGGGRPCPEPIERSRKCRGVDCPPDHPFGKHFASEDYSYQE